jgi:hypothetical protein
LEASDAQRREIERMLLKPRENVEVPNSGILKKSAMRAKNPDIGFKEVRFRLSNVLSEVIVIDLL